MNVSYENKPELTLIGFSTKINPEEGYTKCPEFWDKEYLHRFSELWKTMEPQNELEEAVLGNGIGMFAICAEDADEFEYWIAGMYSGGNIPEGLKLFKFPASKWAVFMTRGPLPQSLQDLNSNVWQEWMLGEGKSFKLNGKATLEVYSKGNPQSSEYECGIWVPII